MNFSSVLNDLRHGKHVFVLMYIFSAKYEEHDSSDLNMLQRGGTYAGKAEPLTCITNLITNQIYRDCYTLLMTNIEQ